MRRHAIGAPRILVFSLAAAGLLIASPARAVLIEDAEIEFLSNFGGGTLQTIEADTFLSETIVHPDFPTDYHTAFAEITNGAIRMSLYGNTVIRELHAGVRDTYTVQGAAVGTPVTLNVQLDIDGEFSTDAFLGNSATVVGKIAGDLPFGSGFLAQPSPHIPGFGRVSGSVHESLVQGEVFPVHLSVSTPVNVEVGETFILSYAISLTHAGDDMLADFTNTGTVSFELPEGVSLTSTNGFGTIPEPSALVLLLTGVLGLATAARQPRG